MNNPPNYPDPRNNKYIPINFKTTKNSKKDPHPKDPRNYHYESGFKLLQPFPFRTPIPQINHFPAHQISNQNFVQEMMNNPRLAHRVHPNYIPQSDRYTPPTDLFVQDRVSNPQRIQNEVGSPGKKDIRLEHLENFSDNSGEDIRNPMGGGLDPFNKTYQKEKEISDQQEPQIKIISPHLVQYFKKHAKNLENNKSKNPEINVQTNEDGAILIKTKKESPKKYPKVSFSKKIKKPKSTTGRERPETQYNMWTINQHFNIGNINPPVMPQPYDPTPQTNQSFPINNPAQDYKKIKEFFDPSGNESEEQASLDPGDVQNNWNLIYQMNLEDKLYLDVSTNNIYLKIDNKNDQRFKHFEGIHQYSKELKDIESQLVPVSESLLPNHLLKLKQSKSGESETKQKSQNKPMGDNRQRIHKKDYKESLTEKLKKTQMQRKKNLVKSNKDKKIYSTSYRKKFQQGCKCSKSKCLRLHCICFKQGKFCDGLCGCNDCYNTENYSNLVEKVKNATKDINSGAFESKFLEIERNGEIVKITKGCTCMKNNCLKNYCECKKNGLSCTTLCKCDQCFNDHIQLTQEEVMRMHTKNSRKKKKIIFQTKDNQTIGFESKEIINKYNK
jgi:hypothetical protein